MVFVEARQHKRRAAKVLHLLPSQENPHVRGRCYPRARHRPLSGAVDSAVMIRNQYRLGQGDATPQELADALLVAAAVGIVALAATGRAPVWAAVVMALVVVGRRLHRWLVSSRRAGIVGPVDGSGMAEGEAIADADWGGFFGGGGDFGGGW